MAPYLNPDLVEFSFNRLAPFSSEGKRHLERTSALLYFLAYDAAVKKLGSSPLDLNHNSFKGKDSRQEMELEFEKLALIEQSTDKGIRQVASLGEIATGGSLPSKRISSNFFTVPVKKASLTNEYYNYPSRPAPLLRMGIAATGINWGVDYHDEWETNLPKFLSDLRGNTPFTDLAVFVTRYEALPEISGELQETLCFAIKSRFSVILANFWEKRLNLEKIFFKYPYNPFTTSFYRSLTDDDGQARSNSEHCVQDKDVLVEKIVYLQSLLDSHGIYYES